MSLVRFASYRAYEKARTDANDAMMALLAGSRLAEHLLGLSTGSQRTLPEIFPAVPHIRRMNLRADVAQGLLTDAESHLSAMAVPYALALHEDYVVTCLTLLNQAKMISNTKLRNATSSTMHEDFSAATGKEISPVAMEQFHLLRLMRNCVIHAGGLPDSRLTAHISSLSEDAEKRWVGLTGRLPAVAAVQDNPVSLLQGELIATLAITKTIAEEINHILQSTLPRETWADLACEDFTAEQPKTLHLDQKMRKLPGYVRMHYRALNLTTEELSEATQRANW